jgi:hypothetical protein
VAFSAMQRINTTLRMQRARFLLGSSPTQTAATTSVTSTRAIRTA